MFFVAAILAILSGLFYAGGPSRDRLAGCSDVPIRQPVLRHFGDDGVMPVICPTCQTSRSTESPPD